MSIDILSKGSLSFNFVQKKRKPRLTSDKNKKLSKLVRGVCLRGEDGEFLLCIDALTLKNTEVKEPHPDKLYLPFTEESYHIKDRASIFTRVPNEDGKYTRYIRNESQARFGPIESDVYVPFCRNWVCSGYIVRRDGKMMFDFNECIAPVGYTVLIREDE